ncbi:Interferon-induced transmembrane protein [Mycobacterium basiliense]|uniref:Interferon-induced transmembrane protein n=1 Tax=Mycobacterium basiliense TaxID=2094119 RepID=A0A447G8M0_9MYCO|nr:CD225/dispanin family protein [Mycobacterium basiliense]VDM86837.1 Interferon-induced transmembrane protein [Mycobacterium basiliense]
MSYPPGPYGGSPEWQNPQPGWQGQQPGWPAQQPGYAPEPDNYLVWAILSTLLCCLPFGIVSIVYSTKVSGLWAQGRYAEAQAASANAKKWAIISAITGAILGVIFAVIYVAIIMVAVSVDHNIPSTITTYSGY